MKGLYLIPSAAHSEIPNQIYSSSTKFTSTSHSDIPRLSVTKSDIPSKIYSSSPKSFPIILPSGTPSSDNPHTQKYVTYLEPSSSSILEESETLNVLLLHWPIFLSSDVSTEEKNVTPSEFSYFMPSQLFLRRSIISFSHVKWYLFVID